jgi:hypothetical protein
MFLVERVAVFVVVVDSNAEELRGRAQVLQGQHLHLSEESVHTTH